MWKVRLGPEIWAFGNGIQQTNKFPCKEIPTNPT